MVEMLVNSHVLLGAILRRPQRPRPGEGWTWAALDSGTGITGGGSGYAAILAHAERALYGTELGSVTILLNKIKCTLKP